MTTIRPRPTPKTNRATLRLYWREMRKYKPSLIASVIAIPAAALLLDTVLPYFLSTAVGQLTDGAYATVSQLIWLAAGAGLIGCALNLVGFQSLIMHESAVAKSLRDTTLSTLLQKDSDFFANQKIGGLTGKFIDFINAHVGIQDLVVIQTLRFIASFGVGLFIIFSHSVLLGGVILFLLVALMVQVRISMKLRSALRHERKDMVATLNGAVADIVTNNQAVKTFAQESHEQRTIATLGKKYQQLYRKDFRWMSLEGTLRLVLSSILQISAVAIIASLLMRGSIDIGVAVFTVAYLQRVSTQVFSLGDMINSFDRLFLQAAPMTEILLKDPLITDTPHAKTLHVNGGEIQCTDVSYHYPDSKELAIKDFTLTIPAGKKVGLVGRSGAGKTTLTRLLLHFDTISSGSITIDGHEIRDVTQESLRHAIAYVPQEPLLFHRSLRENITYGNLLATDEEITEACRKANALEFIEKLPQGLDTIVGERGVKLSGGQRQRVAIARAILKDAPILILDEATSALDSESEKLIQDALEELMKGRTSIVIAHRLSTISQLDRIIVVDHGAIIEDGSHTQLLTKKNGVYAKLWAHQSGGFIEE